MSRFQKKKSADEKRQPTIVGSSAGAEGAVTEGEPLRGVDCSEGVCQFYNFGPKEDANGERSASACERESAAAVPTLGVYAFDLGDVLEALAHFERRGWTGSLETLLRKTERRSAERRHWLGTAGARGDLVPRAR